MIEKNDGGLSWITFPGPPSAPLWLRRIGVGEESVYIPAGLLGEDEEIAVSRASKAGVVAIHLGEPYLPTSWVLKKYRSTHMENICRMAVERGKAAVAAGETTMSLLTWIHLPDTEGTRNPEWQKRMGATVDGTVYITAILGGTEEEIVAAARANDERVVVDNGHSYVSTGLLAMLQPNHKSALADIEARVLEEVAKVRGW